MSSENWLITTTKSLLDLETDKSFLTNILILDTEIENPSSLLSDFNLDSAIDVIRLLVAGPNEALASALKSLDIDPEIFQRWGKQFLKDLDEQDLDDFEMLTQRFSELTGPVERVWPLLDENPSDTRALSEDLILKLSAKFGLKLIIEAMATLPKPELANAQKPAVLRLGLSGKLAAGADLSLSQGPAKFALGTTLSGAADIN